MPLPRLFLGVLRNTSACLGVEMSNLIYSKGEDNVIVTKGLGKMVHGRCSQCMAQVYQKPEGESYFAVFAPTFHIGGDESEFIDQKLPNKFKYLPKMHTNYENRARDFEDSLPKYKTFPPENPMNARSNSPQCQNHH
eukprot:scaffold140115_cov44-Attheya_sp.AAC.3